MISRSLPSRILAEKSREPGPIFATAGDPDFDESNVGVDAVQDQNEHIESAIWQFRQLDCFSDSASLALEVGLRHVLAMRPRHAEDANWTPLTEGEHERLLSAVYEGLGHAIGTFRHRIPIDQLQQGMLAAATLVDDLLSGSIDNDRHRDAASRALILIRYAQISQYQDDIENRRLQRKVATVGKLLTPPALDTAEELFG